MTKSRKPSTHFDLESAKDLKNMKILRDKIDQLDFNILNILKKRQRYASEIAKIKVLLNMPILQRERWQDMITHRIQEGKKMGLSTLMVQRIFEVFHQESIAIQKKVVDNALFHIHSINKKNRKENGIGKEKRGKKGRTKQSRRIIQKSDSKRV